MLGAFKTVRRGERRETFTAFSVLFLVLAGALLETARDALFLRKLSAEQLPFVYIGLAVASLSVVELYARITGRAGKRALAVSLAACAAITGLFWALVPRSGTWVLYLLYAWPGLIAPLVLLQFWTLVGDMFTITQAKRVYGAIGVGSVAGSIAGTALASWLATHFLPEHLLIPAAAGFALAGAASLSLQNRGELAKPVERSEAQPDELTRGAAHVLSHPYARGILLIAVVGAASVTLADYVFKSTVALHVGAAELGNFFARTYLVFNGLSLVCQILFTHLAVRKLGVPLAAAILPAILLVTALGPLALPLLPAVLLIRGTDAGLRHSLHRTAFELLSVPLSAHTRGLVKRLVDVVAMRGGQALASLAILGLIALPHTMTAIMGLLIVLSAAWLFAAIRMRRHYVQLFRPRRATVRSYAGRERNVRAALHPTRGSARRPRHPPRPRDGLPGRNFAQAVAERGRRLATALSEGEGKDFDTRVEKLDLEDSVHDGCCLANQLVHPGLCDRTIASIVDVDAMSRTRRLAIDVYSKTHRACSRWSHDEMKVAGVKPVDDASIRRVQHGGFSDHRPITHERPVIESQTSRSCVDLASVGDDTAGRGEMLTSCSQIGFR